MTVFQDGKPLKSAYRKFRMRDLQQQDDYASMRQALTRRFRRYLDGDEKFAPLPDLLLIDGGEEHTRVAEEVLADLKLTVPTFGMVKDDRHRTRALMTGDGRQIGISGNQAVFSLIGNIQEETHNSAIHYQRSLRKEGLHSALDSIPGIGPERRKALLRQFHTLRAVREAALEELAAVIPANAAAAVYETFHGKDEDLCASSPVPPEEDS